MIGLLRGMGAELVSVGHGRAGPSTDTANAFVAAWTLAGGHLAAVVDWPSTAASWLRQATRLTADDPDAWVISDRAQGWAPLAARLAESTAWGPARTVGFACLGDERLVELAGVATVEGMHGATATGGIWHVHHGRLICHRPARGHPDTTALISRPAREIAPGAIHVPGFLLLERQQELVRACRRWAQGPVPMRAATLPGGAVMSVRTVCLGWHWQPYRYTRTAGDAGGAAVEPLPGWLADLGRQALRSAHGDDYEARAYHPDAALINHYDASARLGMHQDAEERSDAPVVSLSIGDDCMFRFGNARTRGRPYTDVRLGSGDLFVFGGPSRFAYHGVPKVIAGSGDPATGLSSGRLNITLRVTGLAD